MSASRRIGWRTTAGAILACCLLAFETALSPGLAQRAEPRELRSPRDEIMDQLRRGELHDGEPGRGTRTPNLPIFEALAAEQYRDFIQPLFAEGKIASLLASAPITTKPLAELARVHLGNAPLYETLVGYAAFTPKWESLFDVAVVDMLPRNADQFKVVFDTDKISMSQVDELAALQEDEAQADVKLNRMSLADAFDSTRQLVVFVGHNLDGTILDQAGGKHSIEELSEQCAALLKMCIFLSCYAKDFAPAALPAAAIAIGARQAQTLARNIQRRARAALAEARHITDDPILPSNRETKTLLKYKELLNGIHAEVDQTEGGAYHLYARQLLINRGPDLAAILVISLIASGLNCNEGTSSC